ncbi:hypothetical protein NQ318_000784 [Aromia moschata]|uniref:Uncharacterized protein n=1 Tax=Aromia moschata TaxID=1265417 RepID=A0AAV8YRH3_9CUCU|nr:hypothetical protein NQ318_000784 [Aromia moschata]
MDEKKQETNKTTKEHPFKRANFITDFFFCWMLPFFVKGFKKEITEDDIYGPLKAHDSGTLGDKIEKCWMYEIKHKKNPSLWRALFKVFKFDFFICVIILLIIEFVLKRVSKLSMFNKYEVCKLSNKTGNVAPDLATLRIWDLKGRLSSPLLLSQFLKFYEPNQTKMDKNEAYMFAGLLVLVTFAQVMVSHRYMVCVWHLGMKLRVAVCSLVYRKALKLSKSALAETTIGQMVNLLSNDVARFENIIIHVNYLWLAPIETLIFMGVLYNYVGYTGLVGTLFLILFTPIQLYMGKKTSSYRLRTALRTDERVRLMSEIITGIQVIKMYTWEKPFAKLVEMSRRKEMQQIKSASVIRAIMMSLNLVQNHAALYCCILTYVLTGNIMNSSYVYTLSSFYGILRDAVTKNFPKGLTDFAESNVSANRIQKFLLLEEIHCDIHDAYVKSLQPDKLVNGSNDLISLSNRNKTVGISLKNVSVKWVNSLPDNTLHGVSFSAKSRQLVAVVGPVGGGKTTLLHTILKELPPIEGIVDVEGTLSYASQEPWLFGGSVRQNIIFGQEFKSKKYAEVVRACALERDFTLFPYGDRTLIGDRGVTLSGGQRARINLARAVYKDADIYLLDDPLSAVDTHVGRQLFDQCICGYLKEKCVVLVTHQLQYLSKADTIYLFEDGKVEAAGSYEELQAIESEFTKLLKSEDSDEEKLDRKLSHANMRKGVEDSEEQEQPQEEKEQRGSGIIPWKVYKSYFRAGGNFVKIIVILLSFVLSQLLSSSIDYFINIWVNVEQWRTENSLASSNSSFSNNPSNTELDNSIMKFLSGILVNQNALIIYTAIVVTTIVVTFTRSIYFFRYCMTASRKLHNVMFDRIVYATMRFFNTNASGRILNRFSKDIGAIDEVLPLKLLDTTQVGLSVLAISLVIGSLNPWTFLPTLLILVIFYFLRVVYLATSRDIKRVESVTRSPIYTHLAASLHGLTTIRAFGAQEVLKNEFDNYQDKYSAAFFLYIAANRTFGFWLDFHCVIYITFVIISILFVENEIFGGNVGLSLTQSITLTGTFQWGMRQWSDLETNMTSVERVQEYIEISPEKDEKTREPPKFWPEKGVIEFRNMCLRYSPNDPYVLQNLNFKIKSSEKVGIVGRTGAGKSSLIAALFRLTNIEGKILIDNINTKEISLAVLRSKISIIPQEPVLFSGTLRKNLDPFDEYNDDVLWNALSEVELKNAIADLPGALDSRIYEGGSNFSVGQRQLLCLARAIIRNNKILVLDEATANVDPHTDVLIQNTIRRKFADCTVLTIAHRLHTIMDSDKVLVMDAGKSVEFDHPHKLLQNPNGIFYGLVMQTGKSMADYLKIVAETSYSQMSL